MTSVDLAVLGSALVALAGVLYIVIDTAMTKRDMRKKQLQQLLPRKQLERLK